MICIPVRPKNHNYTDDTAQITRKPSTSCNANAQTWISPGRRQVGAVYPNRHSSGLLFVLCPLRDYLGACLKADPFWPLVPSKCHHDCVYLGLERLLLVSGKNHCPIVFVTFPRNTVGVIQILAILNHFYSSAAGPNSDNRSKMGPLNVAR